MLFRREERGVASKVVSIYVVAYFLFHICFVAGLYSTEYIQIPDELYIPISIGATLVGTVLLVNATKRETRHVLPWYDILLLGAALSGCGYMAVNFDEIVLHFKPVETIDVVMGVITILSVVELLRRTLGRLMAGIVVLVFLYAMFSNYAPGMLWSTGFSLERMVGQCYLYNTGMFGRFGYLLASIIVIMLLFTGLMMTSGASKFVMKLGQALVGRTTGGPAKIAVATSAVVGAINPGGPANVALTGSITIPMMKSIGLKGEYAGAVETISSIGGTIMPPIIGISGLIMCDFLGIEYSTAITAALLPGLLYYTYLFLMVHFDCSRQNLTKLSRREQPSLKQTLKEGWQYALPIVVLVVALMVQHMSIQRSVMFAIGALVIVGQFRKEDRLTPKRLLLSCQAAMRLVALLGPILCAVGIMMASLFITGVPIRLSALMLQFSGGNTLIILLMTAFICFVMGTGMPSLASYVTLAVLVAPALIRVGIAPIAAHLFIIYTGITHMITPPSMIATYVAAGIAEANVWRTALHGMRLGICLFMIPFLFVYNPSLLLVYSPDALTLLMTIITAVVGILAFTSGMAGFLLKPVNWLQRVLLIGSGILLIGPGLINGVVGVTILLLVLLSQWIMPRWLARRG